MFTINDSLIVANMVVLSRKEQDNLIRVIKGKDKKQAKLAKEILINRCEPMVKSVVAKYKDFNVPREKLIRYGKKGLLKAAELYDTSKKYRFVLYASWFVRAEIHKLLGLPIDPEEPGLDRLV